MRREAGQESRHETGRGSGHGEARRSFSIRAAWACVVLAGLWLGPRASAAEHQTVIKGIDVVGVPAAQVSEVLRLLGLKEGMQVSYPRLEQVVRPAEERLQRSGRFQRVSVRPTTFIGGEEDGATYLSISLIGKSSPLPALADPMGNHALPEPLQAFFAERARGLGAFRDTLYPTDHDRLEALAEAHASALEVAMTQASDPAIRSRAAQAIAFLPDSRQARTLLEQALRDPDADVRRDAARALDPLVLHQLRRSPIPAEPYLALLRCPEPSDRLGATSLLIRLASRPENRPILIREAGSPLLAMARMKHPSERTLALQALQLLKQAPAPEPWESYRAWFEKTTAQRFTP